MSVKAELRGAAPGTVIGISVPIAPSRFSSKLVPQQRSPARSHPTAQRSGHTGRSTLAIGSGDPLPGPSVAPPDPHRRLDFNLRCGSGGVRERLRSGAGGAASRFRPVAVFRPAVAGQGIPTIGASYARRRYRPAASSALVQRFSKGRAAQVGLVLLFQMSRKISHLPSFWRL
jgi:hypothetical protein